MPAVDAGAAAPGAERLVQLEQELAGGAIGAMDDEAPAETVGLQADLGAMARDPRRIIVAPGLGPPGCDAAGAFRLDEFDPAGIGEGFLRRVDDLHHMALRAGGGGLGNG